MVRETDHDCGGGSRVFSFRAGASCLRRASRSSFGCRPQAPNRIGSARSLYQFKENVEKDLPGQIAVSVHPNSSLFRQGTELPAIQRGNLEMSTMTTFEIEQQLPEYGAFSGGYVFRDYDHMRKVMDGPIGKEYIAAVAVEDGHPDYRLHLSRHAPGQPAAIPRREDARPIWPASSCGCRPGGNWNAIGRGLGVTPTPMAMPEVYLAMKSGAIDGQENPIALARYNNLHEVSQQFVLTSHLVQPVAFAIAKPVWDKLTPAQQDAMRKHARTAADFNDKGRLQEEKEFIEFFKKAGLKITEPDLAAFKASVDKHYADAGLSQKWQAGTCCNASPTRSRAALSARFERSSRITLFVPQLFGLI